MIVFLYGSDSYRRSQKECQLIAEYEKKHSALSVGYFDAADYEGDKNESTSLDAVREFLRNRSLFDDRKLVVFRARQGAVFVKGEIKWLQEIAVREDAMLFIIADITPLKAFSFLLAPPVRSQEFPTLAGNPLRDFVQFEAKRRGLRISGEGLAKLAAEYRGDMWGLMTEIDRLALSSVKDYVTDVVSPDDFMSVIKKMAYGAGAQSLATLERALAHEDPAKIFNVLASFTSGEKKRLMADYDARIKFGTLDYESALTDFVMHS